MNPEYRNKVDTMFLTNQKKKTITSSSNHEEFKYLVKTNSHEGF